MPELTVEMHVTGPDGRFVTAPELAGEPALLQGLNLDGRPNGGLSITDNVFMVLVDDSLVDVAGFFLDELPGLLRAGQGGVYDFRTGPETVQVVVEGEGVVIVGSDGTELHSTIETLLQALAAAAQDYAALQRPPGT